MSEDRKSISTVALQGGGESKENVPIEDKKKKVHFEEKFESSRIC